MEYSLWKIKTVFVYKFKKGNTENEKDRTHSSRVYDISVFFLGGLDTHTHVHTHSPNLELVDPHLIVTLQIVTLPRDRPRDRVTTCHHYYDP